jgi:hypothetical protein
MAGGEIPRKPFYADLYNVTITCVLGSSFVLIRHASDFSML